MPNETGYTQDPADELLAIGPTARELQVSVETIRRWDAEGKIRSQRTLGGQRRFRRGDVDELLARLRAGTSS
ncbi:MAG TPA: MerR family DNA-binding transcriptional regulator [Nocardioides sp.]|uniref:MerR family DNA-binding transcriptional regulator n=1 Tax=Nocardioides sp. TaxID=35761 RepID=UPI002D01A840|nr:MerR family DNA-binding transcriptional regulator [Nocardioides sp.]HTW17032.1 MerR family DNA-binding transcriptional regulator [Nocardioides sp.]